MKTGKRILSIFLVVLMLLTAAPLAGFVGLEIFPKVEAAYKVGDTIQFGSYPQTRVNETPELKELANTATWRSYDYYIGTDNGSGNIYNIYNGEMQPSDFMQFADFFYQSNKYRAVKFLQYRPKSTTKVSSAEQSNQDENGFFPDTIYYFRYESLTWRILDPSLHYIMCENVIDSQAFNNTVYFSPEDREYHQGINTSTYANDYASSSIRAWLNHDFYETAFTESQKANINTTAIDSNTFTSNSTVTNDKVFLLSTRDAETEKYGFLDQQMDTYYPKRKALGTDYAKCQGLYVHKASGAVYENRYNGNAWWLLRTPSSGSNNTDCVYYLTGVLRGSVDTTIFGTRPACCLSELKNDTEVSPCLFSAGETTDNMKHFPEGYDYLDFGDKYQRDNPKVAVDVKLYQRAYGNFVGQAVFQSFENKSSGLCYGMANTTAAFIKHPDVLNNWTIVDWPIDSTPIEEIMSQNPLNCIHDINLDYHYFSEFDLKAMDFVKYGYIYQHDKNAIKAEEATTNNVQGLFKAVKGFADGNKNAVQINFYSDGYFGTSWNMHAVLAVGYKETEDDYYIYLDDSNYPLSLRTMIIKKDFSSWDYTVQGETLSDGKPYSWTSDDAHFTYNAGCADAAYVIGKKIKAGERGFMSSDSWLIKAHEAITIIGDAYQLLHSLHGETAENDTEEYLYWIDKDNSDHKIVSLADDNQVLLADKDYGIQFDLDKEQEATVSMSVDNQMQISYSTIQDDEICISYQTVNENEDNISVVVMGTANNNAIIVNKTDNGITVTGLNDITITYSVNDEVVAETTAAVTDGREVHILVDEDAERVTTDFQPHEHTFSAVVTTEPTCTETGVTTYTCTCGESYTETIPALGHTDADSNGNCTRCGTHIADVEKTDTCPYCGKEHTGKHATWTYIVHLVFWFILNIIHILKK